MFFDPSFSEGIDPRLVRYDKYWGPNYFVDTFDEGLTFKKNYFIA
jgi:hypothetical protein